MREIKCLKCDYVAPNKKSLSNHLRYGCTKYKNNKRCLYCDKLLKSIKPKEQGKFCNKDCYSKWRHENIFGMNAPNYIHGKCNENLLFRASLEYRQWRKKVFQRDNYTCQKCGCQQGGTLEAHHIKEFALHPNLRLSINNGLTLCKECHRRTDNYGYKKRN